ncbi:MAG: tRNA (adenosine(37)-N6)-threonylcarbamoyltransferase complex ATPase subunit type 1 TsaE, partial [Clostridia bacterium]|nr:tRNA (adenosine(37)-N6)-threonylcarbamoyltransferase complex ATPase subunit type 1 TsaE [Clostridia bacterium]
AKALGIAEEVTSPTFTILNVYESGRVKLNHLDMYRVESADELSELGIEYCFDEDAVTVIEWNKFESFDGKVIEVLISQDGDERMFEITKRESATESVETDAQTDIETDNETATETGAETANEHDIATVAENESDIAQ